MLRFSCCSSKYERRKWDSRYQESLQPTNQTTAARPHITQPSTTQLSTTQLSTTQPHYHTSHSNPPHSRPHTAVHTQPSSTQQSTEWMLTLGKFSTASNPLFPEWQQSTGWNLLKLVFFSGHVARTNFLDATRYKILRTCSAIPGDSGEKFLYFSTFWSINIFHRLPSISHWSESSSFFSL